ncbi:MAG: NUDIX hydrolase [Proteobacteria bacterium]|nr:NUDIX hydrolase [Pseudomonadota bacterium]
MSKFWKGFRKHVSTVAIICGDEMLIGRRKDNGKWTNPGGHLNKDEDPAAGAIREVKEESGVDCEKLEHLVTKKVISPIGKRLVIHAFKCKLSKKPKTTTELDPDNEISSWKWISIKDGLPDEILKNLHSPKNVLLEALGLQKKAATITQSGSGEFWSGFNKHASTNPL